jgi:hypothetical protein
MLCIHVHVHTCPIDVTQSKSDSITEYNKTKEDIGPFGSGVLLKSLNNSTLYPRSTHNCGLDLFGVSDA